MPLSLLQRSNPKAFDAKGHLLVFAAPINAGFRGSPLALATGKRIRIATANDRRNWAKRRAYGA
jgi:hypothetical protein